MILPYAESAYIAATSGGSGSNANTESLTVTQNGIYTVSGDTDGFDPVYVNSQYPKLYDSTVKLYDLIESGGTGSVTFDSGYASTIAAFNLQDYYDASTGYTLRYKFQGSDYTWEGIVYPYSWEPWTAVDGSKIYGGTIIVIRDSAGNIVRINGYGMSSSASTKYLEYYVGRRGYIPITPQILTQEIYDYIDPVEGSIYKLAFDADDVGHWVACVRDPRANYSIYYEKSKPHYFSGVDPNAGFTVERVKI